MGIFLLHSLIGEELELPTPKDVTSFKRTGIVTKVSKEDGKKILLLLSNITNYKTFSYRRPGIDHAIPLPTSYYFYIETKKTKLKLYFSFNGALVNTPKGLLVIPKNIQTEIKSMMNKWDEEDKNFLKKQPLPYQYKIGSLKGVIALSEIAYFFYGDSSKWNIIYEANKSIIKNPNIVHVGEVITIPELKINK